MSTPYREPGPCQKCAKRERARWRFNPSDRYTPAEALSTLAAMFGVIATVTGWVIHGIIPAVQRMSLLAATRIAVAVLMRVERKGPSDDT